MSRSFQLFAGFILAAVLLAACSSDPFAPDSGKVRRALLFDGDPIPCDSTIVTDGTCRGGWIIPWSLQGR